MPGIFVSYRRKDTAGHAGRLFDRLRDHFGANRVFRDVDRLRAGDDFVEALARAVDACDVFILVIGRDWLEARNERGQRRLDDPQDFIRLEVETALRRKVLLLPVLVEGAAMPEPSDLPEGLRPLARRQALELSEHRWDFDVQELLRRIEEVTGTKRTVRKRVAVLATAALAVLALAAAATTRIWWPLLNITRSPSGSAQPAQQAFSQPTQLPGNTVTPKSTTVNSSTTTTSTVPEKVTEPSAKLPDPTLPAQPPEHPTTAKSSVVSSSTTSTVQPSDNSKPSERGKNEAPPKPTPPVTAVPVPDVRTQPIRNAFAELEKRGLRSKVESSSRGRGEPGTVYAQRPSTDTLLEPGGLVYLYVVASLRPNERAAGSVYLSPGRVLDLDGDNEGKEGWDVSFEGTNQFFLSFGNGAQGAFMPTPPDGRSSFDPANCERVRPAAIRLPVSDTTGQQVCVHTTRGRTAAIFVGHLTADAPELLVRYATLETTRAEPPASIVNPDIVNPDIVNPAPRAKPPLYPGRPSPPMQSCAQAVQGKIAWDYSGNRTWVPANVERLCRGAVDDQPARCFDRVMRGGINWGGGMRWEPGNALDLCEGTKSADSTIACFQRYITGRRPWQEAIAACDERRAAAAKR